MLALFSKDLCCASIEKLCLCCAHHPCCDRKDPDHVLYVLTLMMHEDRHLSLLYKHVQSIQALLASIAHNDPRRFARPVLVIIWPAVVPTIPQSFPSSQLIILNTKTGRCAAIWTHCVLLAWYAGVTYHQATLTIYATLHVQAYIKIVSRSMCHLTSTCTAGNWMHTSERCHLTHHHI